MSSTWPPRARVGDREGERDDRDPELTERLLREDGDHDRRPVLHEHHAQVDGVQVAGRIILDPGENLPEDILEELVGEIADEYDREEPRVEDLGDGTYRVSGGLPIGDLSEALGFELPEDGADTIGGLVYGLLGWVPEGGETVRCVGVRFTVEETERRRIVSLREAVERPT